MTTASITEHAWRAMVLVVLVLTYNSISYLFIICLSVVIFSYESHFKSLAVEDLALKASMLLFNHVLHSNQLRPKFSSGVLAFFQVPGIFELKGHDHVHCVDVASLNVGGEDQFLPNQKKDVTYVSRLQVNIRL